jgi:hypothetical protein
MIFSSSGWSEIPWSSAFGGCFYYIHSSRDLDIIFYQHGRRWRPFLYCSSLYKEYI